VWYEYDRGVMVRTVNQDGHKNSRKI
jgi:hypothetical protein